MSLGKKQMIKNDDWASSFNQIEKIIDKKEIDKLAAQTLKTIKELTKGKKTAYAWSAGKDSLVLGHIAEKAGINNCMIGVCNLEYPAFMKWIEQHKPANLQIINTGQDMEWLSKHLTMLFPQDSARAARWFSIVQHNAQEKYFKEHRLDLILLGRRKADGNYVGENNLYTSTKGITRCSPLADWSHEQVLAYIHYNKLEMPPIYAWPNGFKCGTHPWPARQYTSSIENGWQEIYQIDKTIVEAASKYIPTAADFLKEVQHES